MNKAEISGTLTRLPDIQKFANSRKARFSLKVKRDGFKGFDYPQIEAWNALADTSEGLKVGDEVYVFGATRTGNYEKDGRKVYFQNITASEIKVLAEAAEPEDAPLMSEVDEDLPF